jgi:hypothetical protein
MAETLSPAAEAFIEEMINHGEHPDRLAVLEAAVSAYRQSLQHADEIAVGVRQLEAGQYTDYDEQTLKERFEQIKREGRERQASRRENS